MSKTRKSILGAILCACFAICMAFGAMFFAQPVTASASYEFSDDGVVYVMTRRTSKTSADNGKQIMFVPTVVAEGYGYEEMPDNLLVPELPWGSAFLKMTKDGIAYVTNPSIDTYVDVVQAAVGFDWCATGTINGDWSEYSCSFSGVQHYSGGAYDYEQMVYYNTVSVQLNKNGADWKSQNVALYRDGKFFCDLNYVSGNTYRNDYVICGKYEIYVNGVRTNNIITADQYRYDGGHIDSDGGTRYFRSQFSYPKTLNYYDFTVKMKLDDAPYSPSEVKLYDGSKLISMNVSNGVATLNDYLDNEGKTYEILINGQSTNKYLQAGNSAIVFETVDFYTLTAKLTLEDTNGNPAIFDTAVVTLRDASGNIVDSLTYSGANNSVASYTKIYQKDEKATPTDYYVYVNNRSVNNHIRAVSGQSSIVADFYEVAINLFENNLPKSDTNVTLTSKAESYVLIPNNNGVATEKILIDGNTYKVTVSGVVDDGTHAETDIVKYDSKVLTLYYFTVNVKTYEKSGTNYVLKDVNFRTYHVRSGNVLSTVPSAYVDGLTFNCFATSTWTLGEKEDEVTEFDYSTPITQEVTLYAHFLKCEVVINDYVRTDENGLLAASGMYLTTPNLVISGFDKGNDSIQSALIQTTDFVQVQFLSLQTCSGVAVSVVQGNNLALGEKNEATNDSVVINFAEKVSMTEAQEYLRTKVVYQPTISTAMTLKIMVSDGVISASDSVAISQSIVSNVWHYVNVPTGNNKQTTFDATWYYFEKGKTYNFDGRGTNGSLKSGIKIVGTVHFYIPTGVTVNAYGSDGSGVNGGAAAVYVPEGATLYLFGGGKLVAHGGNAAAGCDGEDGGDATRGSQSSKGGPATYTSGKGGKGGNGGGGAGAGIGTDGGKGGAGGTGGASNTVTWTNKGTAHAHGQDGKPGEDGKSAVAFGTLYVANEFTVEAYGGSYSSTGGQGGACGAERNDSGYNWDYWHCASGGGGGGGGGSGYSAYSIGTGGAGGAGGGGGGSGGCDYRKESKYNHSAGFGGTHGVGYVNGTDGGTGDRAHNDSDYARSGGGGAGGTKTGAASVAKKATSWTKPANFTVKFLNESGSAIQTTEYYFTAQNISVPDYTPSAEYVFLGWQIATYGKNVKTSGTQPLTSDDKNLFQPGESIALSQYTYGNITLKPVVMPISGKTANDKTSIANNVFVKGTQPATTYYTYTIKLTLDGEHYDFGQIKFVNTKDSGDVYKLTSSLEVGTYTIILTSEKTFNVYVGNQKLLNIPAPAKSKTLKAAPAGATDLELISENEESINFKSLNVNISGLNPQNVTLLGKNAPIIEEVENTDGTHKFTAFAQEGIDTTQYPIQIDDYHVPEEDVKAFYGNTANVVFAHVDATINTNATISNVELRSEAKTIAFVNNGTTWELSATIDEDTVYNVFINGVDTGEQVTLTGSDISVDLYYYDILLTTRIDGVVSNVADVKAGENSAIKLADGEWQAIVVSDLPVVVTIGGDEVATITPSDTLDVTYVDYYTISYTSSSSTGDAPVDAKIYLKGTTATVLDKGTLESTQPDYYFAGWTFDGADYVSGAEYTVNEKTEFDAIWLLDNFKVQYVDAGIVYKTLSKLESSYQLVAGEERSNYSDCEYNYTFKNWLCSADGNYYDADGVTELTVAQILEDSNVPFDAGVKTVTFTAVYDVEYKYGIHLTGDLEANENAKDGVLDVTNGDEFIVQYKVTHNDGINSIVLMPEFDQEKFAIQEVTVGSTVLGTPTLTYDYAARADIPCKILLEGKDLYDSTGDILVTVKYKATNAVGGEYTFGFITDYKTTSDQDLSNENRSHAYFWDKENREEQTEVRIFVFTEQVKVIVQIDGIIEIEDQTFVYDAKAKELLPIEYTLADEFDENETYYVLTNGSYTPATTQPTKDSFGDDFYYTKTTSLEKVLYFHNGYAVNETCVTKSVYTIRWYTYDGSNYTEIDAPKNVGTYYIGISATANDYYTEVAEVKAKITITPAEVVITIDDKESIWNEALAELTGQLTEGTIYDGDDLGINYSTTVTSTSDVGVYADAITGTWNNNANYTLTFVAGDYEILLADNSFVVELKTTDRDYNKEAIKEGTADSDTDFYAQSKYGDSDLTYKFYTFDGETYAEIEAPKNAGTYYVKAFVAGDPTKYADLESDYVQIVIGKVLVTIDELTASGKVYNFDTQVWEVSDISGAAEDALYTLDHVEALGTEDYINVGTPTVRVYAVLNDPDNYTFATEEYVEEEETKVRPVDYKDAVGAITPFAITITANDQSSQYTGEEVVNVSNNYTISVVSGEVPAFVYSDELSIQVVRIVSAPAVEGEWVNVGEYGLTVTYSNDNYTVTVVGGTYTITKAYVVVPTLENFVYDKTEKVQQNAEGALYTFEMTKTDAGTYNIKLTLVDADNYTWVNVNTEKVAFNGEEVYYICDATGNMVKAYLISEFADNQVYYTYGEINDYQEAEAFDANATYYTYDKDKDEYTQATGVTAENFGGNTYYVFVNEEGYIKVQTDCVEFFDSPEIELAWVISPAKVTVTIADKESVYGNDLAELTSDVTSGTVYEGDDLNLVLTKEEGDDAGDYAITGEWTNTNYEVTFENGTYTITVRKLADGDNAEETAKQYVIDAIDAIIKEYTGEELAWEVSDFTQSEIANQVTGDTVFEIDSTAKIDGQNYTDANGKVVETAWTYYTNTDGKIIKKYTVTVKVIDDNYTFYDDVKELTVEVEVFIKQATNEWTSGPSIVAETYDEVVKTSVAKFGDDGENNFVAYYSDATCTTLVDSKDLVAGETYYAKFFVEGNDNYTELENVVEFKLGFNINGELVVYFNGEVSDKEEEIIYNGLLNYFETKAKEGDKYNADGEGTGYTYTVTATDNAWKDVGTYTLTFSVKDNWLWADNSDEDIVYTLVIKKAPLKITVDDKTIEYLGDMPDYTVATSDDDFVNGESFETYSVTIANYISCGYEVGSPVGTYAMTLADDESTTLAKALYNYSLTLENGTLTVNKHVVGVGEEDPSGFDINVTMEDVEVTYDAQSHSVVISNTSGVVATYTIDGAEGNSKIDVKRDGSKAVKSYEVIATLTLDGEDAYGNSYAENYELNAETITANLTINPFEVTVTAEDKTSVYGDAIKELTSTVVPAFFERDSMTVTAETAVTLSTTSDVGEYAIKAKASGTGFDNYTITYVDGKYTITIATNVWTVELVTVDREYNGSAIAKGTSESYADYFSEAKFGDSTTAYTFYTYNGETYTAISAPTTVGTYYVKAKVDATNNYKGLESEYVEITISKKVIGVDEENPSAFDINVTMEDVEATYDAQSHSVVISNTSGVVATYTIDGAEGNSKIDVKRNATTTEVEAYEVIATLTLTGNDSAGFSYADNYELRKTSVSAKLTINPLAVKVTAENKQVTYGDAPATPTNVTDPEFYARDSVSVTYTVKNGEAEITLANDTNVGVYTIIPLATKISNYTVTYENGTYTIGKAEIKDGDSDGTPDDVDDESVGLKITVSAEDVYYNRTLNYSSIVKVGTLTLDPSVYTVKFYDKDSNEVTPVNAGTYTVKVTVSGTGNYNGAVKTATFEIKKIALKPTTFTYNAATATWTVVTEDAGAEGVSAKALKQGTELAYTIGDVDYTSAMSYTATAKGTYTVKVTATNDDNYLPSEATTVNVYTVDFAEGTHEHQEAKGVEGIDAYATQYRFSGQKATKPVDPTVIGYTFKQWNETAYFDTEITADTVLTAIWDINTYTITWYNQETEIYSETYNYKDVPTYKTDHGTPTKTSDVEYTYTFAGWNTLSDTLETIELPQVTENATYYAIFSRVGNGYTITYYISEDGGEYREYKTVTNVKFDDVIEIVTLDEVVWFKTESWYTDKARTVAAPEKMVAQNLSLYGAYLFDIGLGDVNADGIVNVDDITMYRQWIVGNYDLTDVESGTEWTLVRQDGFTTDTHYFVKRVADVNAMVENSGRLDIRDASTIRMALVGGFNWGVVKEFNVTGQEVAKSQRVATEEEFVNAVNNLAIVTLSADIELTNTNTLKVTKDTTIYLNGHTITATSFKLTSDENVTITIVNGKIVTENGVEISAPNGSVVLNGLEVYDNDGKIELNATTESLHFEGENKFYKGTTENHVLAEVTIPADTRVVVEAGAKLEIAKIIVTAVEGHTLKIVVNSAETQIVVNTEVEVEGAGSEAVKVQSEVSSETELLSLLADAEVPEINVAQDFTLTQSIYVEREVVLNLNGHTISAVASGKLVGTDSMFVIKRGGKLTVNDTNGGKITTGNNANVYAPIKMTTVGETETGAVAEVEINGGTFEGYYYAIVGNGKRHDTAITVNGGVLKGLAENDSTAIYHPQNGMLTINGGEFIGATALYIKAGTVNITGGTFTANGEVNPYAYNGNGFYQTGDAIVIDNCNYPGNNPVTTISDDIVLTDGRKAVNYWYVKNESQFMEGISKGEVVVLGADITLTQRVYVEKDIILNLNGRTITYSGDVVPSGLFTITRGNEMTVSGNGTINSGNNAYAVFALTKKGESERGEVAKLTIENGTFIGYYYAIVGNGNRHDTAITVNGGVLKGVAENESTAIYHPQDGTLTITGGEFIGATALYIKAGTVNITGGTFTANGEVKPYAFSSNGFASTGDAIVIDNCNYPGDNATVTIDKDSIVLTDGREIKTYEKAE